MTLKTDILLACATVAAICVSQPAVAQYYYVQGYGQPYVYPYVVVQQPYARPAARPYPTIIHQPQAYAPRPARKKARRKTATEAVKAHEPRQNIHRTVPNTDPALIEDLRRKTAKETGKTIDKVIVVREKPVVVERKRYVDDPVKVVRRHKVVDVNVPAPRDGGDEVGRVIHAEAEVTILGPDRMNIRLFRKGLDANAKVGTTPAKPD